MPCGMDRAEGPGTLSNWRGSMAFGCSSIWSVISGKLGNRCNRSSVPLDRLRHRERSPGGGPATGARRDVAVKSNWDGFTCGSCGDYQEEDTTGAACWQWQAERCGKLLKAIFIDGPKKGPGDHGPLSLPLSLPPMTHDELWREHHPGEPVPGRLTYALRT